MSLLIPLGLLGLLSVIALILIYIIKPNYQQKRISSTYVWKLSLRYKKKRIPVSRLSQILLFLCQLLILILCAILLAKPAILEERVDYKAESVVIIDASASMMVTEEGESRFEKAVTQVQEFAKNVMDNDGVLSVILAGANADFLVQRSTSEDATQVSDSLTALYDNGIKNCTYGSADMDGAVELAEQVLEINTNAKVYLYTGTKYINKNGIEVVPVTLEGEWNVAILDCSAKLEDDNYYSVSVDVGCYGRATQLTVYCDIYGVNDDENKVQRLSRPVFFSAEDEITLKFTTDDFDSGIYSFKYINVYVDEADSFEHDNSYDYYGGAREKIKIQYASSDPNTFFSTICRLWRTLLKDRWDVDYTILKQDDDPATEGYDFYIFEHKLPDTLPTDGVVMLIDPDRSPSNSDIRFGDSVKVNEDSTLALGKDHVITKFVNPDNITISNYRKVTSAKGYEELLHYANDPILLVKNEIDKKIVVCTSNLNFSNIGIRKEFPLIMLNMFNYFFPSTFKGDTFEIGQTVTLNARGENLTLSGPEIDDKRYEELPADFKVERPGTYTLTQETMNNGYVVENFFVHVPNFESNITKEVDSLPLLHITSKQNYADKDLIVYFAAALFAIMFVEWLLQSREYFR